MFIVIYLELEKGTHLTPKQMQTANCRGKWNAVSKSYAQLTGHPYIIKPNYSQPQNKTVKNQTQQTKQPQQPQQPPQNNKTRPQYRNNNQTRKYANFFNRRTRKNNQ